MQRVSQIGRMDKEIFSMRNILNTHFILFHLRVIQFINKTLLKNNSRDWKSTMIWLGKLGRVQMPLVSLNTNHCNLSPRLQIKTLTKDLSLRASHRFRLRKLTLFSLRQQKLTLILQTRMIMLLTNTKLASLIRFHIHDTILI